jgi:hypothetical protein
VGLVTTPPQSPPAPARQPRSITTSNTTSSASYSDAVTKTRPEPIKQSNTLKVASNRRDYITKDTSVKKPIATPKLDHTDRRILVTIPELARLDRPAPFPPRRALVGGIEGLTLAMIPGLSPTKTGWLITPSDLTTRDLLMVPENQKTVLEVLGGTSAYLPVVWHNYALTGVPSTMMDIWGERIFTESCILEQVIAQTKKTPVNCRPSRHGADQTTGICSWIISFLEPVASFSVFNTSNLSSYIKKKPVIAHHAFGFIS